MRDEAKAMRATMWVALVFGIFNTLLYVVSDESPTTFVVGILWALVVYNLWFAQRRFQYFINHPEER